MQESGVWIVELINLSSVPIAFHAWIETDDLNRSQFVAGDVDPACTIGSIACGPTVIVVGAYDARIALRPTSDLSAQGPTRNGGQKPDLCAPGEGVVAAKALSQEAFALRGTSMAAPHVAGATALMMQAARRPLSIEEIRHGLLSSTRHIDGVTVWDPLRGMGDLNAAGAIVMSPN
jgi:subtilisin family serine protease